MLPIIPGLFGNYRNKKLPNKPGMIGNIGNWQFLKREGW